MWCEGERSGTFRFFLVTSTVVGPCVNSYLMLEKSRAIEVDLLLQCDLCLLDVKVFRHLVFRRVDT